MSSIDYHVSATMLDWIASTQGTDRQGLATLITPNGHVGSQKLQKFLNGIVSQSQADKLIKLANIPFGFLFLKEPPAINFAKPNLPDFRIVQDSEPLSADFYDVLNDIYAKIDWYRDYLKQENRLPESLSFVGRFSLKDKAEKIASDITQTIGYDIEQRGQLNKDKYFSYISELLEKIGILVFKSGIVKGNTHRKIQVREFRGFAIADKQVPVIFVNGADAVSAQLFTLLHEAAHIWLGESGISNPDPATDNQTEKLCNQIAGEFLVPKHEFLQQWQPKKDIQENLEMLAKYFHVSTYVIAIKALQNKLIAYQVWQEIRQNDLAFALNKTSNGGSYYNNLPVQNSKRLTQTIVQAAMNKKILLREGANLLNAQPNAIVTLYKKNK